MKRTLLIMTMVSCFIIKGHSQTLTQVVKGRVIDAQTTYSLPGANVVIQGTNPLIGTTSDADGYFRMENVPVGRYDLVATFLGYNPGLASEIQVHSAKEVYIEITMEEAVHRLEEAVVIGKRKEETLNEMALISARSFTVDEAMRYAGSFNDPARMAVNFAGAASTGDMRNDIVVRGNSPNGIVYRLEGVNIPNPNHLGTTGSSGGYYSMLSQNTLSKSDFLTGAFPAQYGDALGGIFDLNLRKGNNEKREYTFTIGLNGIEATAEGPFSKKSKASYLINYRFSTLGAFDAIGVDLGAPAVPKFQDISYKVHIPFKKGYLKLYGLGGRASVELKDSEVENPEDYFTLDKPSNIYSETGMNTFGVAYKQFYTKNMFGKVTLATSLNNEEYRIDTLAAPDFKVATPIRGGMFDENTYSILYDYSIKLNTKNKIVSGVEYDYLDMAFDEYKFLNDENETFYDGTSYKALAYAQLLHRINDQLSFSTGLHTRYFDLTKSLTFEPRASIKWALNSKQSLNAGFGLHSQGFANYAYFIEGEKDDGSIYYKYRNADPSMSQHYILGYNYQISNNLRLKIDGYYQKLYNVPVEKNPSYWSAVNVGGNFDGFPDDLGELTNNGSGTNMGVEITVERFLNKGYYYLLTASVFDSKYRGSDNIERNTAFNGNYIFNALMGKEFKVGASKQNTFGVDFKTTVMGGRRYIPIDKEATQAANQVVYNYTQAYENKHKDYFRMDLKFSYNVNRPKVSHQFILDIQNISNNQNVFTEQYNISTGTFSYEYQQGFMPNIQYKILF